MLIFKRILLVVVAILAPILLVGQFIRPNMTPPPVDPTHTLSAATTVPPEIGKLFERSCNDCHSNKTVWPWYAKVFPTNWWLHSHVTDARKELNLSEWATYSLKRKRRKLDEICEQVNKHEMPLKSYLPLHPAAKLSEADRNAICDWTNAEKERLKAQPSP